MKSLCHDINYVHSINYSSTYTVDIKYSLFEKLVFDIDFMNPIRTCILRSILK